jgi:predicted flap endonuclease-1-like 5' DNA nuclease
MKDQTTTTEPSGERGGEDVRALCGLPLYLLVAAGGLALLIWKRWRLWAREELPAAPAIEVGEPQRLAGELAPLQEELPPAEVRPETPAAEMDREPGEQERQVPVAEARTAEGIEAAPPSEPDDLRRIEGIGPKIAAILQQAGIHTFSQLADAAPGLLRQILEASDPRLARLADPTTWSEQARFAANGDWEALAALQSQLKGGRRV